MKSSLNPSCRVGSDFEKWWSGVVAAVGIGGDLESRSKKRAFGAKMMLKSTPASVEVRPKGIKGRKRSSSVPIVHG
jgi:hypothetical protein